MPDPVMKLPLDDSSKEPVIVNDDFGLFEHEGTSYKLDKDGNALGEDGVVKYTSQQLEDLKNPKPPAQPEDGQDDVKVDIDGVVYTVDKDGNAVDDNGNVKYTKAQIDELSPDAGSDDEDYIGELKKRVNIEIKDESGKPVEYENTIEGIAKYVSDVKERTEAEVAGSVLGRFFSSYPGLEDAYYYARKNGGSLEGYTPQPDYDKIAITDDVEQHKALIYAERIAKGDSKERAARAVKVSIEEKLTKEDANEALEYLKGITVERRAKEAKLLKDQEKLEEDNAIRYTKAVSDTIDAKKIVLGTEEIVLPSVFRINDNGKIVTKTQKDFKDYIFQPKTFKIGEEVVELTQNQYDLFVETQGKNHNHEVYEALRRFLKYDDSQLIKGAVAGAKAKEIKKFISGKPKAPVNTGNTGKFKLPI